MLILDRDLHPGALEAASANLRVREVVDFVHAGRKNRNISGDLAEPEILDEHLSELLKGVLLILTIHRRACIDHIPK